MCVICRLQIIAIYVDIFYIKKWTIQITNNKDKFEKVTKEQWERDEYNTNIYKKYSRPRNIYI